MPQRSIAAHLRAINLPHFFFFDVALWVLLAGIFLPTFEKLIDGGTG
jgi:hypothetical protein